MFVSWLKRYADVHQMNVTSKRGSAEMASIFVQPPQRRSKGMRTRTEFENVFWIFGYFRMAQIYGHTELKNKIPNQ